MKKNKSTIILILVFFVGLSVMLYPTLSDYVNQLHQSRAVATYAEDVDKLTDADYSAYFEEADAFNAQIAADPDALYFPSRFPAYENTLDVTGTGIMGYITIEKIGVELPIYHGTSDSVLQIAAGHLEGTSLPVGGKSTHAVISAHRGLPSAKLFTNLDRLEVGDTFTITVLDRVLTYEVDNISIVLPTETDNLKVVDGKDYVTLMTCTFVCRRCGNWLQGLPKLIGRAILTRPTGSIWKNACCKVWCWDASGPMRMWKSIFTV